MLTDICRKQKIIFVIVLTYLGKCDNVLDIKENYRNINEYRAERRAIKRYAEKNPNIDRR